MLHLPAVGFAQANHAYKAVAQCKYHDVEPPVNHTQRNVTGFPVVVTGIFFDQGGVPLERTDSFEINLVVIKVSAAFLASHSKSIWFYCMYDLIKYQGRKPGD